MKAFKHCVRLYNQSSSVLTSCSSLRMPEILSLTSWLHARSNAMLIIVLGDDGEPAAYEVLPPEATQPLV